ncbi:early activation antigen CD69-like isoform X3 [Mauremys reevesii]|nr:early activation antigen CD69-like isoform X3 [Mauremys reevesii]XP_039373061.1 early activation antigen CD69-like isoform X3 [Mauremys reevesii]XP_039373062.1 early activation antigen CD69-like isoform X3 [Mauremys reevesii]XP_039373063.1 early activation antigen CD69-like isoform X3 [Mauremys reevesii]XP_039373064.1 early activation antigen CD69-like isoform X3 [Mauremys reevesii]
MAGESAEATSNTKFSLKLIKDKWIPITVTVVITALIITVIALAARKPPPYPRSPPHVTAACPDRWVGYQGKCYYFSETEGNWNNSQSHCSALNASLASIDSLPELDFTLHYKGLPDHWIGLQRERGEGQPWKWTNGFRSEGKGSAPTWMNMGSAAPGATQRDISSASGRTIALEGSQVLQEGTQCLRSRKGSMQPLQWMQNLHIHHLLCSILPLQPFLPPDLC